MEFFVVCTFLTFASVSHVWHLIMAHILCHWLGFAAVLANCKVDTLRLQASWPHVCSVCVFMCVRVCVCVRWPR